jgi:hypothetical protein
VVCENPELVKYKKKMQIQIEAKHRVEWLLIFLILDVDGDDVDITVKSLLWQVRKIKLKKYSRVFFIQDIVERMNDPKKFPNYKLNLSELFYDAESDATYLKHVEINGIDLKNSTAWSECIIHLRTEINATFNALITWSHGAALRIANGTEPPKTFTINKYRLVRDTVIDTNQDQFLEGKIEVFKESLFIKSEETDCIFLNHLFICEIAKRLQSSTEKKIDLMIMANCYSNIIDNCYNLRNITKYYVASSALVTFDGFDFCTLIRILSRNFEICDVLKPKILLYYLCSKFIPIVTENRYFFYKMYMKILCKIILLGYQKNASNKAVLVASRLECDAMTLACKKLDLICCYIIAYPDENFPILENLIVNAANIGIQIDDNGLYDMLMLLSKFSAEKNCSDFERLRIDFQNHILKTIFISSVNETSSVKNNQDNPPLHYRGLYSVYLPPSVTIDPNKPINSPSFLCEYWKSKLNFSDFVSKCKWDNLVREFVVWVQKSRKAATT